VAPGSGDGRQIRRGHSVRDGQRRGLLQRARVDVELWKEKVVAVTGKEILVFELGDVERAFEEKPFLTLYRAYLDRLKGLAFKIKRIKWILEP